MADREIYMAEMDGKYLLTAYVVHYNERYLDHHYEGDHMETLIEDFLNDNPEYKNVGISWE